MHKMAMTASYRMRLLWKWHYARMKCISRSMSTLLVTKDNQNIDQHVKGRSHLSVVAQGGSPLYLRNGSNTDSDIVVKEYAFCHPLSASSHKNLAINVLNSLSYTNTDKLKSHQLVQLIQSVVEAQYTYLYMQIPWLMSDIRIAKNQMQLMECDQSIMEHIVTHSSFMTLRQLVCQNLKNFTADELSQVLLSLFCLGLQPEDELLTSLLLECHSKFDEFSLKGLADLIDCYSLIPRTHLFMAKPLIRRVHECLNEKNGDIQNINVNHIATILGGLAALEPCDLCVKALDNTLNLLEDNDNSLNSKTILAALKLVSKVSYEVKQVNKHTCSKIVDKVCLAIKSQISSLNISEVGQIARYLSKCNAYGNTMQDMLVGRAQELLSSETRISNILASLNTLTKYSPNEVKDQFVEAVMNTKQDIDIMHLSNLASICHLAQIKNMDFIQKYQKEIAENVNKILKSDAETMKIIKFLIFNKFIDKSNEMKFVDALLDSLHGNHGISNFRNTSLVSFLLCHAETGMSENLLNKMLASIPKWSPSALYTFMCGLNKMKEPMPFSLKKQVSFIQEFLYSHLGYKVKHMNDIPRLLKVYIGLGTHSKRRDPALIGLILDELCKAASTSILEDHDYNRILSAIAEKRTPYRPEICDILAPQIVQYKQLTSEKMLRLSLLARVCAIMGHQPVNFDEFMVSCKDSLNILLETDLKRAFQLLLSMTTIEAYPEEALSKVFTMEVMERIDNIVSEDEVKGKALQNCLSLLNRDVVLECPQLNVPWFSEMCFTENFCNSDQKRYGHSLMNKDFIYALESVLGGTQFFKLNTFSQYFHYIDAQILLNQDKKPINVESLRNSVPQHLSTRIAVLFHYGGHFCYGSKHLKGYELKRVRQLQILGYKVVQVPHFEWFSMARTSWQEKIDYLSDKIYRCL